MIHLILKKSRINDNQTNLYHVVCERVSSFAIGRKRHVRWMNKSNSLCKIVSQHNQTI